jgi:hypothetical protein
MRGIADTGLIVAFGNRADRFHPWAVNIAKSLTEPLLTREAIPILCPPRPPARH